MELAELTLKGSSFSSWLDFQKAEKDYEKGSKVDIFSDIGIAVNGKSELKVNGSSKYYEPVYEVIKVTDDQMATATSLDVTYQEYLGSAPSKSDDHEPEERLILPEVPGESETPEDLVPSGDEDDYDDDLPF